MSRTLVLLNTTGRQAASIARVASAVGFSVRAHVAENHNSPLVADELTQLRNTTLFNGNLGNPAFLTGLFHGADCAFINTTAFDTEEVIGNACIDHAAASSAEHVIYSSMPDHRAGDTQNKGWQAMPQWKGKAQVEKYAMEKLGDRVTVVHTGIYHNNFTTLPYPLFQMREVELGPTGDFENGVTPRNNNGKNNNGPSRKEGNLGFEWCAPFPADKKLPWLDCEQSFGPAILQIFKDGAEKWGGKRYVDFIPVKHFELTLRAHKNFVRVVRTCASAYKKHLCRYVAGIRTRHRRSCRPKSCHCHIFPPFLLSRNESVLHFSPTDMEL